MGRGVSGSNIKETWAKSRGRKEVRVAGVGWWGGEEMQRTVIV